MRKNNENESQRYTSEQKAEAEREWGVPSWDVRLQVNVERRHESLQLWMSEAILGDLADRAER